MIITESFENATEYCARFRAKTPPHYNQRRQFARPVPSLVANAAPVPSNDVQSDQEQTESEESADENTFDNDDHERSAATESMRSSQSEHEQSENEDAVENEIASDNDGRERSGVGESMRSSQREHEQSISEDSAENEIGGNGVNGPDCDAHGEISNDSTNSLPTDTNVHLGEQCGRPNGAALSNSVVDQLQQDTNSGGDTIDSASPDAHDCDVKNGLAAVDIDVDDVSALNNLVHDPQIISVAADADLIAGITLECGETAELKNGKIVVTKMLDNGLEMTYTYGEKPVPLAPLYNVKINDVISGNVPFKENVSRLRSVYSDLRHIIYYIYNFALQIFHIGRRRPCLFCENR